MTARNLLAGVGLAAAVLTGAGRDALACACCADLHVRVITRIKVADAIAALGKSTGTGTLTIAKRDRKARFAVSKDKRIMIRTADGAMVFSPAGPVWHRRTDISFIAGRGGAGSAQLLKEYVLRGPVRGTGVFKTLLGEKAVSARLVLYGVGNACAAPRDLRKWVIHLVRGRKVLGFGAGTLRAAE